VLALPVADERAKDVGVISARLAAVEVGADQVNREQELS
jgi:hypothetical protein